MGDETPGTPGQGIVRPVKEKGQEMDKSEAQLLYKSGVGMLLYLVKHS
jgi:hypothetical protein